MSLTPKNWSEFQHYKDRKPSWIKLHRSLLDDYEFSRLPVASRALAPLLWLLASEYEGGIIPCNEEALAFRLRIPLKELRAALTPLIESGFFDASKPLAEPEQPAIPERETQVTSKTEKNICNLEFEKLRRSYPKRKGSQGWPTAEKLFNSYVKSGHDPNQIVAAAKKYATTVESSVGTEFVPMAETWLRKRCFLEFIPTAEDLEKEAKIAEFMRSKGKQWVDGQGWVAIENTS